MVQTRERDSTKFAGGRHILFVWIRKIGIHSNDCSVKMDWGVNTNMKPLIWR